MSDENVMETDGADLETGAETVETTETEVAASTETTDADAWRSVFGDDEAVTGVLAKFKTPQELIAAATSEAKAFPADWRERMATGKDGKVNAEFLGRLKRYEAPTAVGKALFHAHSVMTDSTRVRVPTDDSTPDELAEFRKAIGVPDAADAYAIQMPDGVEATELDQKVHDLVRAKMHSVHAPQAVLDAAVEAYGEIEALRSQAMAEAGNAKAQEALDSLNTEWQADFRANINMANALVERYMPEVKELFEFRLMDGTPLGAHEGLIRGLVRLARDMGGAAAFVGSDAAPTANLQTRYDELLGLMRTDPNKYASKAVQDELMQIGDSLERQKQRAA